MNKFVLISALLLTNLLHAATQPKFTIIPTTATSVVMKSTDVTSVQYVVTNKTKITRTLTMSPITTPGIVQITGGSGACSNPFTLAQNQSCLLNIQLTALQLPVGITATPVKICKTITGTNTPDPFLCSQTSQNNNLDILRLPETARITVNTHTLNLTASGSSGSIKVTNQSYSVIATNISADLSKSPLFGNVTQNASDCVSVAPRGACTITFTPGSTAISTTSMTISGNNTTKDTVNITISSSSAAQISVVSGSPLNLTAGSSTTGTIVIQNNSTSITATNIAAILNPTMTSSISQDATDCASVLPGATCNLVFTPGSNAMSSQTVPVYGTNTSKTTVTLAVNASTQASISITSGSPLALPADGATTGTMVIQNNSSTTPAINVIADLSAIGSVSATTCPEINPNESCTITFTPGTTVFGTTSFNIQGTNTTAVAGEISVNSYLAFIVQSGNLLLACSIDVNTGAIASGCSTVYTSSSTYINGIAFNIDGTLLYMSTSYGNSLIVCDVLSGGISNCYSTTVSNSNEPLGSIAYNPLFDYVYIASIYTPTTNGVGGIFEYLVGANNLATLNGTETYDFQQPYTLVFGEGGDTAYVLNNNNSTLGSVSQCSVGFEGGFSACYSLEPLSVDSDLFSIAINSANSYLYISNHTSEDIIQTNIPTLGETSFTTVIENPTNITGPESMALNSASGYIYITNTAGLIYQCTIDASSGNIGSSCIVSGPNTNGESSIALYPTPP